METTQAKWRGYRLNGITSALTSGEEFPTLHVHESEGVDA